MERIWNKNDDFIDPLSERLIPKGFSKQPKKIADRLIADGKVILNPPVTRQFMICKKKKKDEEIQIVEDKGSDVVDLKDEIEIEGKKEKAGASIPKRSSQK